MQIWNFPALVVLVATGLVLSGCALFLLGKYNLLVTLRQKLTGDIREIDFILRVEIEELRKSPAMGVETRGLTGLMDRLAEAERSAHRSAAQELGKDNLLLLIGAANLVQRCRQKLPVGDALAGSQVMTTGGPVGSVADRLAVLTNLTRQYNAQLNLPSCRLVAWLNGFTGLEIPGDTVKLQEPATCCG